jgi:ribA/ribD-fused uncharacterized protein
VATDTRALDPPPNVGLIDQFTWRDAGRTVHGWPSNFCIEPDGTNVEAEFQVEKARPLIPNPIVRKLIRTKLYANPGLAKKWGRGQAQVEGITVNLSKSQIAHWDSIKVDVMRRLIEQKAADHEEFRVWLLSTGDTKLVEGNWWHDQFWGSCQCRQHFYRAGENWLGVILMQIRDYDL